MIPALSRRPRKSHEPDALFAESIRGLVFNLERAGGGKMPQVITVTSAMPGDGKSLVASALCRELVASGRRVLFIDGDLQRGVVHTFFDDAPAPGLADILNSDGELASVVRKDLRTGIEYIPRGCLDGAPYQARQHVAELIQYARTNGQIVVFDSAPVLASSLTSILVEMSDRVILVVRWARSSRRNVDLAVQRLLTASRDDVAIVINGVNPKRHALYGFSDAGLFAPQLRKYHPTA